MSDQFKTSPFTDDLSVYTSMQEFKEAMADPRYFHDNEYTERVNRKADRSEKILFPAGGAAQTETQPGYHRVADARNPNVVSTDPMDAAGAPPTAAAAQPPSMPPMTRVTIDTSTGRLRVQQGNESVAIASTFGNDSGNDGGGIGFSTVPGRRQ